MKARRVKLIIVGLTMLCGMSIYLAVVIALKAHRYDVWNLEPFLRRLFGVRTGADEGNMVISGWVSVSPYFGVRAGACIAFCVLLAMFFWRAKSNVENAERISYLYPFVADYLPADEILVRGSEEPPVAQSEVLLRAAKEQTTRKEELLRSNEMEPDRELPKE